MKKTIFITILSLFAAISAWGETSYTLTGSGDNLTLTITGTGDMPDYDGIWSSRPPWESQKTKIKTLVIEDGITSVGEYAFYYHEKLTSVIIPNSVIFIGSAAFEGCDELASLDIGKSVSSIGRTAFAGCSKLTSLTIPNSVVSIEDYAFFKCYGLASLSIGNAVESFGESVFYGCNNLIDVTLENGTKTITLTGELFVSSPIETFYMGCNIIDSPFKNKTTLTSLTIGNSVTSIEADSFSGCSGLESLIIPNSVTFIGDSTFLNCSGLTHLTISNSVSSIGVNTFAGCSGLTSLNIPNSITSIGHGAFSGCNGLTSLTIPNSVMSIGQGVFSGCSELISLSISESVTSIEPFAFSGCSRLASLSIPESVISIGYYAFSGCSGLTSLTIPDSVISIGYYAFSGCSGLTSLTIPDSVISIGNYAFSECSGLVFLTLGSSVISIDGSVFFGCDKLKTVIIKDGNETLTFTKPSLLYGTAFNHPIETLYLGRNIAYSSSYPNSPFRYKNTLTSLAIGNSVTSIDESAFLGCSKLASLTLGESVTSIGNSAFQNCTELTSLTIPDSVTSIGEFAFSDCSGLTSLIIGNSIAFIEKYAFSSCYKLTSLIIPKSVISIGEHAFSGCNGLTSITFGNSVISIGNSAFSGCSGLTSLIIPNPITSIGEFAFSGCNGLISLTIGNSVTSIGSSAFSNCYKLKEINSRKNIPPQAYNGVFSGVGTVTGSCILYVPIGSYSAYKEQSVWKDFFNIREKEFKEYQNISFTEFPDNIVYGGDDFKLRAVSGSGLPVIYESSNPEIITINGNIATVKGAGEAYVTARCEENEVYESAFVQQLLKVGKVSLSVNAQNETKYYGDEKPQFKLLYSGFRNNENENVLDALPTIYCAADVNSPVGFYDIILLGGADNNYSFEYHNGNLEITKAALTITAEDKEREQGEENPIFTLAYSGFKNNENESVLDMLPTISCVADINSPAGFYDITLFGGSDNNYAYTLVNGKLEIIPVTGIHDKNALTVHKTDGITNAKIALDNIQRVMFSDKDLFVILVDGTTIIYNLDDIAKITFDDVIFDSITDPLAANLSNCFEFYFYNIIR